MAEEEDGTVTDITAKLAEALREALSVATTHRVAALDAIHGARGQTAHVVSDGEWYAFEDRVRAALSALPSDDGWMPIETAPKDGRWVLVTWEGSPHRCEAMRYEAGDWYWYEGDCTNAPPTHWRPLPDPPSTAALGGGG